MGARRRSHVTTERLSEALREALGLELTQRLGAEAPQVVSAWSRQLPATLGPGVVMYARIRRNHHSEIVESAGGDGDAAFQRLVEQCSRLGARG